MRPLVRSHTLIVWCLAACGCAHHRTPLSESALQESRHELVQTRNRQKTDSVTLIVDRLRREYDAHSTTPGSPPPRLDILFLSGGGDSGAFGAGFLKGWGRVPAGPMARPQFDVVTGCSTGAMIAPFAYLGTDADYEKIEVIYRNPRPDWVRVRGALFFLPFYESFTTVPGLQRELRTALDRPFVERIAAESRAGRLLFINTTNLDDGCPASFELSKEAQPALEKGRLDRLHRLILASTSVPGIFPPQLIDSAMCVDGGISSHTMYVGGSRPEQRIPSVWRRRYPDVPMPRTRYWVILNHQVHVVPKTVKRNWPDILGRTIDVAGCSQTILDLRLLAASAALASATEHAEVEVRLAAIPDDWRPHKSGYFVKETMNDLADLGEHMGADPSNWTTEIP